MRGYPQLCSAEKHKIYVPLSCMNGNIALSFIWVSSTYGPNLSRFTFLRQLIIILKITLSLWTRFEKARFSSVDSKWYKSTIWGRFLSDKNLQASGPVVVLPLLQIFFNKLWQKLFLMIFWIFKVHIFWEGHKILRNLPLTFDYSTYS